MIKDKQKEGPSIIKMKDAILFFGILELVENQNWKKMGFTTRYRVFHRHRLTWEYVGQVKKHSGLI